MVWPWSRCAAAVAPADERSRRLIRPKQRRHGDLWSEALTRDALLDAVWGDDVVVAPRTVDNFVSNLKRKLGWTASDGWSIQTVRGVGYRLDLRA